jgi:gas vesicle protein
MWNPGKYTRFSRFLEDALPRLLSVNQGKEVRLKMRTLRLYVAMFLAVVVGMMALAIGLVLGLILAPRSGQELRDEIRARLRVLQDDIQGKIEESKPRVSQAVEKGRTETVKGLDKAKEMVDKYADAVQTSLSQGEEGTASSQATTPAETS